MDNFSGPVRQGPDTKAEVPAGGVGLCLSGGGFRAMLFHVGVLQRLNLAGRLPLLDRVSSVSGGSITAALLGLHWNQLKFTDNVATNFDDLITEPIRAFAHLKVDLPAVAAGALLPFVTISDRVVSKFKRHLYGDATLQDLPETPRFILNATNLESGVLLRFSRPYVADYKVGRVDRADVPLADAVAASSAFPPFLSPYELDLSGEQWRTEPGNEHTSAGYRNEILLSDGGVYDNLGIETVWKRCRTVLISDASGHTDADPDPARDWARGIIRVLFLLDSQVRALRRSAVVDAFTNPHDPHDGFFISTVSDLRSWPVPANRPYVDVDPAVTERLAAISTRLTTIPDEQQELLINWGFAAADAGLLAYLDADLPAVDLPYPDRPLKDGQDVRS
ncbi:patatin-like phospholipase family protein [Kribbella sandramycini]|uniref:NTE family protein n=1 Tax=Kribbella sandramycini TaxID=60450 RepID=A0A7Y4KX72_9ACTN|nr:patatin-like phospholipase family protein [Kribbella sandramycini]MBB6569857.1 NTE family protein [Kribbella sandramycini]NOL40318.1 patatin-like phospholipase family protein [Kribbella sandramycini]